MKARPDEAATRLANLWKIEVGIVREGNDRRSYRVEPVTREGLAGQQRLADAFRAEGPISRALDTSALGIWQPPGQ